MRVKFNSTTIRKEFSVAGGTEAEWTDFFASVINTLIGMGAPLNPSTIYTYPVGGACSFSDETVLVPDGGAGFNIGWNTYGTSSNITVGFDVSGYGKDSTGGFGNAFHINEYFSFGKKNSLYSVGVTVHSIKSGDSFYFGFMPDGVPSATANINFAITKMRRLSDPTAEVGYAMLSGVAWPSGVNMSTPPMWKTVQYVEGLNYDNGYYNAHQSFFVGSMPEVDTGKILLMPVYSGLEDVYYENVYLSAVQFDGSSEKAFETDKGAFLISVGNSGYGIQEMCTMVFDITDALSS